MATRSEKTKLGIFTVVATALLILVVMVFAGSNVFRVQDTYTLLFTESVAGLNTGAPVRLRGVKVGSVKSVKVNPENVEEIKVEIGLEPDTPVKADMRATVGTVGLTGLQYIDLRHGTAAAKTLPPRSQIAVEPSLMGQLSDSARDLTAKSYQIADQVADLTRPQNREQVEEILENTNALVKNLAVLSDEAVKTMVTVRRVLDRTEPSLVQTLTNVGHASARLDTVLRSAQNTMATIEREVQGAELAALIQGFADTNIMLQQQIAALDLGGTLGALSKTLAAVQRLLSQVVVTMAQNEEQVRATLYNVRQTSENIEDLSRQLRNQPSRLLFDERPPERELGE